MGDPYIAHTVDGVRKELTYRSEIGDKGWHLRRVNCVLCYANKIYNLLAPSKPTVTSSPPFAVLIAFGTEIFVCLGFYSLPRDLFRAQALSDLGMLLSVALQSDAIDLRGHCTSFSGI